MQPSSERSAAGGPHVRGRVLAEPGRPIGYAALLDRYDLPVPLPQVLAVVSAHHRRRSYPDLEVYTPRHRPVDTLAGHLMFALKWEGVNLSVLSALFKVVPPAHIAATVRSSPTGAYTRRLWFLYEWLTGTTLDVPDPGRLKLAPVLDETQQVALAEGVPSPRHKVLDNLPGTRAFCPLVRWTPLLRAASARSFDKEARRVVARAGRDVVNRAAALLRLSDSRSSLAIGGEQPSAARAGRWARAIAEAGARPLLLVELERLQRIVIGDDRFVRLGVRTRDSFVGLRDRHTGEPLPEHISARPQDLPALLAGLVAYESRAVERRADPVVTAATLAVGLAYIRPFEDGNGRLHRWLVHHVLARAAYTPPGVVLPISAAILGRIDEYKAVLASCSTPLLTFIDWQATSDGDIDVRSDTSDFYRYFDATTHAEFLYTCVEQAICADLPAELRFVEAFDGFATAVKAVVEMPDSQIDRLRVLLGQSGGHVAARPGTHAFEALTNDEVARIEAAYSEHFPRALP